MRALVDRHVEQIDELFRSLEAGRRPDQSPEQELHLGIELFASLLANDQTFRAIWTSGHSSRELVAVGYELTQWGASRVAGPSGLVQQAASAFAGALRRRASVGTRRLATYSTTWMAQGRRARRTCPSRSPREDAHGS